ncbi:hypothetical protein AVP43_01361 [Geobacillus stearothermophilus]|nr:hypothetical protein GARCT_00116 [Geobacillus sp. 12AMOR1]KZE96661.1 hypothetical protein AVP43_01361 [Geobacillus stearothermophilus]STO35808.1 Uncharacterised protein [[Flavobacterium] thermophilum]
MAERRPKDGIDSGNADMINFYGHLAGTVKRLC